MHLVGVSELARRVRRRAMGARWCSRFGHGISAGTPGLGSMFAACRFYQFECPCPPPTTWAPRRSPPAPLGRPLRRAVAGSSAAPSPPPTERTDPDPTQPPVVMAFDQCIADEGASAGRMRHKAARSGWVCCDRELRCGPGPTPNPKTETASETDVPIAHAHAHEYVAPRCQSLRRVSRSAAKQPARQRRRAAEGARTFHPNGTRRPTRPRRKGPARASRLRPGRTEVPRCGDCMRVLALIEHPPVVQRILRHLGLRDHPPPIAPPRTTDLDFHAA